jgi:DNA-binding HxlR family transcriptional regulator
MIRRKILPIDYVDFLILILVDKGYGTNEFLAQITDRAKSAITARVSKLEENYGLIHRVGDSTACMYYLTEEGVNLILQTYKAMNISLIESENAFFQSVIVDMKETNQSF